MLGKQLIQAASVSAAAGAGLYVEDVFSTYLYDGTGSTQTITNGLDLSGEGGLVWLKERTAKGFDFQHQLFDTVRGANKYLITSTTNANVTNANKITSFNSTGFTLGSDSGTNSSNSASYASWSFRKAPGFFDVVTYTGNGTAGRTVSHNLGSVPGFIMVKCTSGQAGWWCYHRSIGNTYAIRMDSTSGSTNAANYWNSTTATSTEFTLGNYGDTNGSNKTFIAYVFAHDDQSFGTAGNESIIKCDLTTMPSGITWHDVNLGWEPQWVLVKNSNAGFPTNWHIFDNMRGVITGGNDNDLNPNATSSESLSDLIEFTPRGFRLMVGQFGTNQSVIYMAIRRPHKPPTAGTDVFNSALTTSQPFSVGFPTDLHIDCQTGSTGSKYWVPRLTNGYMSSTATNTESAGSLYFKFDLQNSFSTGTFWGSAQTINWQFRRAPGFFDVVAFTSANTSTQTVNHNLGAVPEFFVLKKRNSTSDWQSYHASLGNTKYVKLDNNAEAFTSSARWNNTTPTATQFTLGSEFQNSNTYIAYLFATLAGVSKVGSYTGTGNNLDVDCGFAAGARFVLIKRTDTNLAGTIGNWWVYDTARGIVSGNDPYLWINSTAAEVTNTDYIDPLSSGFTVTSSAPTGLNASGGTYIFLAIA